MTISIINIVFDILHKTIRIRNKISLIIIWYKSWTLHLLQLQV